MNNLKIVGTQHIAQDREVIKHEIEQMQPDVVAVELDKKRYKQLMGEVESSKFENLKLLKNSGLNAFIVSMSLGMVFKVGSDIVNEDVVGSDFKTAIEKAREMGAEIKLIDRDIDETYKRLRDDLPSSEVKLLGVTVFMFGILSKFKNFSNHLEDKINNINKKKNKDKDDMSELLPVFSKIILDERNEYMANELKDVNDGEKRVLAFMGADHKKSVEEMVIGKEPKYGLYIQHSERGLYQDKATEFDEIRDIVDDEKVHSVEIIPFHEGGC